MIVGDTVLQQRPGTALRHCLLTLPALLVSALALACSGCTTEKSASGGDTTPARMSAAATARAQSSFVLTDSATQATAAALEQLLFSQAAPTGFPQAYWSLARRVYDGRHYAPLWAGSETSDVERRARLALLCRARDEGIVLALPHSGAPVSARSHGRSADSLARRDLRLTFALAQYLATLAQGAVGPLAAGAAWHVAPPLTVPDSTLASLILTPDGAGIANVMPASPQYALLSRALKRLLDIEAQAHSGWPADSVPLRPGSRGPAVERIRQQLVQRGDLAPADSSGSSYDATVTSGVRNFQRRVGLAPDGRVGPTTRAALNVTPDVRARALIANMERYRWIPRAPLGPAVILDIAEGSAQLLRNGVLVLNSRIRATSSCGMHIPPVIADTIARVSGSDAAITVRFVSGDSVVIRSAARNRNTSACLIADDLAALRGALATSTADDSPATELYLIWPTAYVGADSALMYRHDVTGADARLGARLPATPMEVPDVCDTLAEVHAGAAVP
jgi:murein L,D-transpeptidase YcbB/YkuD